MPSARKLVVKKEALADLRTDELRSLAAGATPNCPPTLQYCSSYCGSRDLRCLVSQFIDPCLPSPG